MANQKWKWGLEHIRLGKKEHYCLLQYDDSGELLSRRFLIGVITLPSDIFEPFHKEVLAGNATFSSWFCVFKCLLGTMVKMTYHFIKRKLWRNIA